MKKVLILCLHRPDRSPSQRYRFEQYLDFLSRNGFSFDFSYLLNAKDDKVYYSPGNLSWKFRILLNSILKRTRQVFASKRYDLVFVQREAFMLGTAFFEKAIGKKVPMIFDFDDAIWMQTVSEANKKLGFLKDASKTAKIIEASSLVIAGNRFLADYAGQFNPRVEIIPTTIDMRTYNVSSGSSEGPVCIGWTGSFSTIEHFSTAIPALVDVQKKYGSRVRFEIIGDENYYCEELKVKGKAWRAATEVKDVAEFDMGIMPLPDTEWAKGKCGLKGLQYMALGIPALLSPVGVNTEIIQHGVNGFLPATKEDWVRDLSYLIEDVELRKKVGAAGKRTVEEQYSVSAWENKYLELFQKLTS